MLYADARKIILLFGQRLQDNLIITYFNVGLQQSSFKTNYCMFEFNVSLFVNGALFIANEENVNSPS